MAQRIGDRTCDHSGHIEPSTPSALGTGVVCSVCARIMPPKGERTSAPPSYRDQDAGPMLLGLFSRVSERREPPVCRCGQSCTEIMRGQCCRCRRDSDCCQFCDR